MNIGLTELYVNLKNWDFNTNGKYQMDIKEGQKYMYAYNCQKECEQELKDNFEQEVRKAAVTAKKVGKIAYEIDYIIDTMIEFENGISIEELKKKYEEKLMKLRNELYNIAIGSEEVADGKEEKDEDL